MLQYTLNGRVIQRASWRVFLNKLNIKTRIPNKKIHGGEKKKIGEIWERGKYTEKHREREKKESKREREHIREMGRREWKRKRDGVGVEG